MFHSDTLEILHQNKFGVIAKCADCNMLQLEFGNVVFSFTQKEFIEFDAVFDKVRKDFEKENDPLDNRKRFFFSNPYTGLILSFNYNELKDTIDLMNYSNIMLSYKKITNENES